MKNPNEDLIRELEASKFGSCELSKRVFLALGGELRREPISKQSAELGPELPYWPGEKEPLMGLALTTNIGDTIREVERRGFRWGIARGGTDQYCAAVGSVFYYWGSAAAPTLCAALLRALS